MSKEQIRYRVFKGRERLEAELRQLNQHNAQKKHYHMWGNRSGGKPSFNKFPNSWSNFEKNWEKK